MGPIVEPSNATSVESPQSPPPKNTSPVKSPRRIKSLTPPSRHSSIQSLPPPKSPFRVTLRRKASKGPFEKKSRSFRNERDESTSEQRQGPLHRFRRKKLRDGSEIDHE